MIAITVKNFRRNFSRICVLFLVLLALFWAVPKFYGILADNNREADDLRELKEPLRVEATPNSGNLAAWFNYIDSN